MAAKNPGGRPPKFTCVEEMERLIEAYFEDCKGEILYDDDHQPVLNKWGDVVMAGAHPPTVTGLALALGFATRSSLMDYQGKAKFAEVITRAKSRIEQYTEERLFDRDGSAGARFSLQNNFRGWKTEAEVTVSASEGSDVLNEVKKRMNADDGA